MAAVAAISAAVIGASTATYTAVKASDARAEAKKNQDDQNAQQNALLDEAKKKQESEDELQRATLTQNAQQAQKTKQNTLARAAQGRKSTILTGPLGLPGAESTPGATTGGGNKTLLGQ